jgi:hypothetical protein
MTSRTLGYTGDRFTNVRPDGLDRMTNVRISRIIASPYRPIRALASGQLSFDLKVQVRKAPPRRKRDERDFPVVAYPWTLEQAHGCLTSHAWAGLARSSRGDYPALVDFLHTCWADPRPACWPPQSVIPSELAVMFLMSEFARINVA